MSNDQDQTPTWGQKKMTKTRAKNIENNNNDKGYNNRKKQVWGKSENSFIVHHID